MSCNIADVLGAWSEIAYITIWKCGDATGAEYAALTESIEIDQGTKDIEYTPTMYGGRIGRRVPQGEILVSMEAFPLSVGGEITSNATGTSSLFQGGVTWPTTQPKTLYATHHRDMFRISILWTDDPSTTLTGAGSTALGSNAYRFNVASAICTQHNISFTDGLLKASLEFKVSPFNKWKISNVREESTNGTDGLPELSDYSATNYPQDGNPYTWI